MGYYELCLGMQNTIEQCNLLSEAAVLPVMITFVVFVFFILAFFLVTAYIGDRQNRELKLKIEELEEEKNLKSLIGGNRENCKRK